MTTPTPLRDSDLEIIRRYTDQPRKLPRVLLRRIEDRWGGLPVQLYAMADLDASMRLSSCWVALGPEHIALVRGGGASSRFGALRI